MDISGSLKAKRRGFNIKPEVGRRGGLLHKYLLKMMAEEFKKYGCKVEVEKTIGEGKTVDLVVNDRIAIEIETGESDFLSNIEKLQQKEYERILFVCINRSVKRKVEDKTKDFGSIKVSVIEVSELNRFLTSMVRANESKDI